MNKLKGSLVALMFGGGLAVAPLAISHAGLPAAQSSAARQLDDDHGRFPHMHKGLEALRDARHQLEDAEDIFKGHREEALDHVDKAIKEVHDGLIDQGDKDDDKAVSPFQRNSARLDDDPYPHLRKALKRLHEAKDELSAAEDIFKGHRDKAIEETDRAIHQIEEAIH